MLREPHTFPTVRVNGGKQYVEVKNRVAYLASVFGGEYSIETEYHHFPESSMWVVKARLTLRRDGVESSYTGLSQEVETERGVNATSALENAETSAVGRACAMAGIGVSAELAIASADEVRKAENRQQSAPRPAPSKPDVPTGRLPVEMATEAQKGKLRELIADGRCDGSLSDEQAEKVLAALEKPLSAATTVDRWVDYLSTYIRNRRTDSAMNRPG